jgi:HPt (histidine-containing phosphotransfer) domain-containing protein
MKGDREACLEAGMDAYLSKPINTAELFAIIESLTRAAEAGAPAAEPAAAAAAPTSALDVREVLERLDGDRGLLREVAQLFRDEAPQMLGRIRACIDNSDAAGLEGAAHSLKGACANLSAKSAAEAAFALELKGRARTFDGVGADWEQLQCEAERLDAALASVSEESLTCKF